MGRRQGESREVKSLKKIQAVLIHFPFGSFNEYFIRALLGHRSLVVDNSDSRKLETLLKRLSAS